MLWWFVRKTTSAVLKTSGVAGAAAAFSVYATPDLQWVDSHVGTGLTRIHEGKATALDAVQYRIPISQVANVARSTNSINLMKLETHIAKQIMLADERRCALFASRLEMTSALMKTTSLESEHSGVKMASGWLAARLASLASLINPAPLQFRQKTHDSCAALHDAIKVTKLNAGDAVGHSCIVGNGSDGHGVVLNDTTFGDKLEVRTWIGAEQGTTDKRTVQLRLGQSYRANHALGWVLLPPVATYFWILNRWRLHNAVAEASSAHRE